jgi:tetratricopeptide (TPR) repeat protein
VSARVDAQGVEVPGCGTLENAFGPFDYRNPAARGQPLYLVELGHFSREVETLQRGKSGTIIGDLDYTLRAFPNHHRALNSLGQYAVRGGKFTSEIIPTADCYFLRAATFAPDDEVVHVLYGNYLYKSKSIAEARAQYEEALRLAPASAEINYNAGLFFLAIGDLQRAKGLAKVAYDQGYPLTGLKTKIETAESGTAKKSGAAKR